MMAVESVLGMLEFQFDEPQSHNGFTKRLVQGADLSPGNRLVVPGCQFVVVTMGVRPECWYWFGHICP